MSPLHFFSLSQVWQANAGAIRLLLLPLVFWHSNGLCVVYGNPLEKKIF